MAYNIIGISAFYHDSAATLLSDGIIVGAVQEERFSRIKHDSSFPGRSIEFLLAESGLSLSDIDLIAFYDKPFLKFERILESYHSFVPKGLKSFLTSMPIWIKEKLFIKKVLFDELKKLGGYKGDILFPEHHLSHAASAFYPSPFKDAAILTIDGVGEWATATIGYGSGNAIQMLKEMHYPHSLGLLYSAFTYFLGFRVNNGEYKVMGLAPYGNIESIEILNFKKKILDEIVSVKEDGSIQLNMDYFRFATALKMIDQKKWEKLFDIPMRVENSPLDIRYANLALAIQKVTEEIVIKMAAHAKSLLSTSNLVVAGGVALNSVANGELQGSGLFENIWIQPAAGDSGGSLGAAKAAWHIWKNESRSPIKNEMKNAFLGPSFENDEIETSLQGSGLDYVKFKSLNECIVKSAEKISEGKIIGFFQGKMEFGPRALGHRSIIADPRDGKMQRKLNSSVKFREDFRPFAPAILKEHIHEYFYKDIDSPFMLFVHKIKEEKRISSGKRIAETLAETLQEIRSDIPAVTHIDYSARVQTVTEEENPIFHKLLSEFHRITSCPVLINTSFNLKGEPIVCTPEDAIQCFRRSEMDYLVIGNFICQKTK